MSSKVHMSHRQPAKPDNLGLLPTPVLLIGFIRGFPPILRMQRGNFDLQPLNQTSNLTSELLSIHGVVAVRVRGRQDV